MLTTAMLLQLQETKILLPEIVIGSWTPRGILYGLPGCQMARTYLIIASDLSLRISDDGTPISVKT